MSNTSILLFFLFLVTVSANVCDDLREKEGETNGCGKGWKRFQRPSGGWCIKVFFEELVTQAEAEKRCQAEKATLTGFQNQTEVFHVTTTATTHLKPATGSLWVGLKRNQKCLKLKITKNCTTMNSFDWTDKLTTGTHGFIWNGGEPLNYGWNQDCVVLTVGNTGYVETLFQVGTFDDVGCEMTYKNSARAIKGFVCGKKSEK
ncbi:hypothetical protein CAEBREN_00859 [Caenorhabditis brenneri]|uniref:C-type lectin domain-containing protein n=1 Tax=Caenorhabditis brenneri TaxID=135651 RepID=G0P647_CAEBE|nr:hypothetical protein CAEBREN_00859 [Caenorhabditis brenneri]